VADFIADMSSGDWIHAALLGVAIIALCWTAMTLSEQIRGRDFENYLSLWDRYARAWRRFRDADEDERYFEFTELINLLEASCKFYNENVIRGTTRDMVRTYLVEVLPAVFTDPEAIEMINKSFSGPDTFFEIRRFARKENVPDVPQQ